MREGKQVPVWDYAICAKANRRLFEATQFARRQTGACLDYSSLREGKQAPVWGYAICARVNRRLFGGRLRPPAKFGRVLDKSPPFLVPGKLPCLGRGLREDKRLLKLSTI